jgi:hypothetical protein
MTARKLPGFDTALQDALLAFYNEFAKDSDVNVERRIASEKFDYRDMLREKAVPKRSKKEKNA